MRQYKYKIYLLKEALASSLISQRLGDGDGPITVENDGPLKVEDYQLTLVYNGDGSAREKGVRNPEQYYDQQARIHAKKLFADAEESIVVRKIKSYETKTKIN